MGYARGPAHPTARHPGMARKKILVVDDSAATLSVTRHLLEQYGYEVISAIDGLDALQVALRQKPDLIVMDFVMPRMSGIAACRKLRDHPVTGQTPILMLTSRVEPEDIEAGYQSGCTGYLSKPLNPVALLDLLLEHLGPHPRQPGRSGR